MRDTDEPASEVVRRQLAKTISYKTTQLRGLEKHEKSLREDVAEVVQKRKALEAEVAELDSHLEDIGGRVEEETD